jgi:hypothetical protein
MWEQAQKRPADFDNLPPEKQWAIDKELGILDWDGSDDREQANENRAG